MLELANDENLEWTSKITAKIPAPLAHLLRIIIASGKQVISEAQSTAQFSFM